jgi:hypothetical protein
VVAKEQLNGQPPQLSGKICEGFLCESFVYDGKLEATANVTYLRFGGTWYRLYFEPGLIFWREAATDPREWSVSEEGWTYPHSDVAQLAGVLGEVLECYDMEADSSSARVYFHFRNGRHILIEDDNDNSNFRVA